MTAHSHLESEAAHMLQAPEAERIAFCREDRWILYPAARQLLKYLDDLYAHPTNARPPCCLIISNSGNGKSSILEHYENRHRPTLDAGGFPVVPLVRIDVPPDPTESALCSAILWKLMKGHKERDSAVAKRAQVAALLRQLKVKMLMIDEFNNLAEAGRQTRALLIAIRTLTNDLRLPICAAGTSSAINALNQDDTFKKRFQPYPLPAWRLDRNYLQFLAAYERVLTLAKPSGLATAAIAPKLYAMCGEAIGETVKLLKIASVEAIRSGEERITPEILDTVYWVPATKWGDVASII